MNALTTCLRPAACKLPAKVFSDRTFRRGLSSNVVASASTTGAATLPAGQRAIAKFCVYKGKSALQLSMIGPTWKNTSTGAFLCVDREGAMFAEFANVHTTSGQQVGYGDRSYNWEQKVVFALKPAELGNFLNESMNSSTGVSMYHDPDKGSQNEGAVKKTFGVKRNPDESYMFTISQNDKSGVKTSVAVPVNTAEMEIIRNLVRFSVPRLLGFDVASESLNVSS